MKRGESGINCLLAVDKPIGMTSHDVVYRVRRALGEKRVGHAGTLDPAASGVLVVGVGQGTRLMGLLTAEHKAYRAMIEFGSETNTDDAEGTVTRSAEVPPQLTDEAFARDAVAALVGEHDQVPPAFSAISVDGRRSYDRARAGEEVELEPRHVSIDSAELVAIMQGDPVSWVCDFSVSKGTYIRSIARDLGRDLGSAAHLSALQRVSSGELTLSDCISLETLAKAGAEGISELSLDPVEALGYPTIELDDAQLADVRCGKRMRAPLWLEDGGFVSLVHRNQLVGVWQRRDKTLLCKTNFPSGIDGVR